MTKVSSIYMDMECFRKIQYEIGKYSKKKQAFTGEGS